tara:strand:- start:1883 stop:2536 length:654 start_codon:yes stop_codon:yes gene_type:complete
MCFSAAASFTASGVTGALGAASLSKTRTSKERPLASIPLLFGIQQLVEGLVWLSFRYPTFREWNPHFTFIYSLFSHILWPSFVPYAVFTIEPDPDRRRKLKLFIWLGGLLSAYLLVFMIFWPVTSEVANHSIRYNYHHHFPGLAMGLYLICVCASCLLSSLKIIRFFGAALGLAFLVAYYSFTFTFFSVWCFFGAILSLVLYFYFWNQSKLKRGSKR